MVATSDGPTKTGLTHHNGSLSAAFVASEVFIQTRYRQISNPATCAPTTLRHHAHVAPLLPYTEARAVNHIPHPSLPFFWTRHPFP